MVIRKILVLVLFVLSMKSYAQQINVEIFKGVGFGSDVHRKGLFDNNGGVGISYQFSAAKFEVTLGGEFRTIDWGNQIAINLGAYRKFMEFRKFEIGASGLVGWAIPLFYGENLNGIILGAHLQIGYRIKPKHALSFFIGPRADVIPGYSKYGNYRTSEINFGMKYSRLLFEVE